MVRSPLQKEPNMTEAQVEIADQIARNQAIELAIVTLLQHSPAAQHALKTIAARGIPEAPGSDPAIAKFMILDRVTAHLDRIVLLADLA
jgi:hypothetical protein